MQRIGVLRGGISDEYPISLKTGARIIEGLRSAGYDVIDMLIDREGVLHVKGIPATLEQASAHVDMVWNALHGEGGEDGRLQKLLDDIGLPYVGTGAVASAMTANKLTAKEQAQALGIKTPQSILVMPEGTESVSEITQNIYRRMAPPWVVKPLTGGGSNRTYFAFTPLELAQFVEESVSHGQAFIVEQYIYGREASVGVIDQFRGQSQYVLPVVEIKSAQRGILTPKDRESDTHAVVGGGFRSDERELLSNLARTLHTHFGAGDYSQSEFIVDKQGKIWYLETDTSPHLHTESAFSKALHAVGGSVKEFVQSIITKK